MHWTRNLGVPTIATAATTATNLTTTRYHHHYQQHQQSQKSSLTLHLHSSRTLVRRKLNPVFFVAATCCYSVIATPTSGFLLPSSSPPLPCSSSSPPTLSHRFFQHPSSISSSPSFHTTKTPTATTRMMADSSSKIASSSWDNLYQSVMIHCILPLNSNSHKGSSGRIGIVGGCAQYTGAPYYAAMSALKTGSDLAFIFCAQEAAIPIKCYSPELLVSPIYVAQEFDTIVQNNQTQTPKAETLICNMVEPVVSMMERLHCLVIGPGLGRCPMVLEATARIIQQAKNRNIPLVIDADGLYLLTLDAYSDILVGYDKVILTPNVMEYKRLQKGLLEEHCYWQNAIIVQKGQYDTILQSSSSSGGAKENEESKVILTCHEEGGLKRSGGIGDILAGCIGTLVAWNKLLQQQRSPPPTSSSSSGGATSSSVSVASISSTTTTTKTSAHLPLACWTACCFVKRATKKAFDKHRRAMTAPDVLEELGPTMNDMTMPTVLDDDDP